jgi:hypothetical protein
MNVDDAGALRQAAGSYCGPLAWFINPYLQIGIGAVLVTVSEVLLKMGADAAPQMARLPMWMSGVAALASGWTWAGILFLHSQLG